MQVNYPPQCSSALCRRDSFVTHRAFCDALAHESAKIQSEINTAGLFANSDMSLGLSQASSQHSLSLQDKGPSSSVDLLRLGTSEANASQFGPAPSSSLFLACSGSSAQDHFHGEDPTKHFNHDLMQLHNLNSVPPSSPTLFNLGANASSHNAGFFISDPISFFAAGNLGGGVPSLYGAPVQSESVLPQLSATALLQKAAEMGATGVNGLSLLQGFVSSSKSDNFGCGNTAGESMIMRGAQMTDNEANLQDLMNSFANGNAGIFAGASGGIFNPGLCEIAGRRMERSASVGGGLNSDGLTRDFLGVGSVVGSLGADKEQNQDLRTGLSGSWPV